MLTKDHVQCRLRKERLSVHWLSSVDRDAMMLAHQLIHLHQECVHVRYEELIAKSREFESQQSLNEAFLNILEQRLIFIDKDEDAAMRWSWWEKAQELRLDSQCHSLEQYQRKIADAVGVPFNELGARLYADVPEQRVVRGFRDVTSDALLREFNFYQLSFFLSECDTVSIKFPRKQEQVFFQAIADCRLSPIYKHEGKHWWRGEIAGPAELSGKNAKAVLGAYLELMAQLNSMSEWQVDLRLQWKGRPVVLVLNAETLKLLSLPRLAKTRLFASLSRGARWLVSYGQECYVYADFVLSQRGEELQGKVFYPWQAELLEQCLVNSVITSRSLLVLENAMKTRFKKKIEAFADRVLWFDQIPDEQAIIAYQDALPVRN